MIIRIAIACASLAWAGFVFTSTIGDPGRGDRVAAAVLADDDARAEIVAPITAAIVGVTPGGPELEPLIASQVDALLQSPDGAAAFIDPFAGSWARMLGEDDQRPAEFDLAPLTDQILAAAPELGQADLPTTRFDVPAVPLPRTRLDWMSGVRSVVSTATMVLAVAAAIGFVAGFAIGDRRWTLRRIGYWATFAGLGWVVIPPLITWAAGRWATGADSVVEVAVGEAVGGLRSTAIVLMLAGLGCVAGSFAPNLPGFEPRAAAERSQPTQRPAAAAASRPPVTPRQRRHHRPEPDRRPLEPTAAMPTTPRAPDQPVPPVRELPVDGPDVETDGDDDDLWDYYAPGN